MQISYTWLDKWVTPVVTVVDDVGKAKLKKNKTIRGMVVPAFIVFSFYYWSGLTVYTSMS